MQVVLLFPGQGSQKPGMGKDLAWAYPAAAEVFRTMDHALGIELSQLAFEGPEEELTKTLNAQPALLAHGAAVWAVVRDKVGPHVVAAAGHSLGEFTAYHAAGAINLDAAVALVRRRGELMWETGNARPGAMAAILGDLHAPIEGICEEASAAGLVVPANYNSPGQIVISGEVPGVEKAMELAKAAGAKRCIKLNVSGAFHSPLMEPAEDGLQQALSMAGITDARFPVFANVSAEPTKWQVSIMHRLARQLTRPVLWTGVVSRMAAAYPHALYVEMGPGSVLSGLVRKIAPGVQTMTCGTPADVEQLLAKVG
ncbi:MAG: ACP S-malonyltransferase [Gemmatimonadetes bacterium]|nr:ACP S-malonyltransferase [Gemmatimonadota bacterium]